MHDQKINILWVVNNSFPEYCFAHNLKPPVFGGWMYSMSNKISQHDSINLAIVFPSKNKFHKSKINGKVFYSLPYENKNRLEKKSQKYWKKLIDDFRPEIVHFHGTEYSHGISSLDHLKQTKKIVSIQGLISVYNKYYFGGMTCFDILRNITFRDILLNQSLYADRFRFSKKIKSEVKLIKSSDAIIGRTEWDKLNTKKISCNTKYYHNNENLRPQFYNGKKWNVNKCDEQTLFLSQAHYPIKGAHKLIDAMGILKNKFPKIKLRVAGSSNPMKKNFFKMKTYDNYLRKKIKHYGLSNNIEFMGPIDEKQMILNYQRANIFISPSSIENSPNSVGEAQIIGVPVISSRVGGINDFIEHNKTGLLYDFDDINALVNHVTKIFTNKEFSNNLSKNEILVASNRHNSKENYVKLVSIYQNILK